MGNSYRTFVEEERRLAVLRVTAEGSGVANDGLLKSVLNRHWGLRTSSDQLAATVAWLAEHGLVVTRRLEDVGLTRVQVTPRGRDVAEGRTTHPGVTQRDAQVD